MNSPFLLISVRSSVFPEHVADRGKYCDDVIESLNEGLTGQSRIESDIPTASVSRSRDEHPSTETADSVEEELTKSVRQNSDSFSDSIAELESPLTNSTYVCSHVYTAGLVV